MQKIAFKSIPEETGNFEQAIGNWLEEPEGCKNHNRREEAKDTDAQARCKRVTLFDGIAGTSDFDA